MGSKYGGQDTLGSSGLPPRKLGIVIMDHGSRLDQSNEMLQDMAAYYGCVFAGLDDCLVSYFRRSPDR